MELNLEHLHSFAVLVRTAHFGRAAEELHMTTSGLSKRIRCLEREVGALLVERGPGGYQGLTDRGRSLAERAPLILIAAHSARRDGDDEVVVLGFPGRLSDYFTQTQFGLLVDCLSWERPLTHLRLQGVSYADVRDCVINGSVDVLIDMVDPIRAGSLQIPLAEVSRSAVVTDSSALGEQDPVFLQDVVAEPILHDSRLDPSWMGPWVLADVERHSPGRLVDVAASGFREISEAVRTGRGIAVVPGFMAQSLLPAGLRGRTILDAPLVQVRAVIRCGESRPQVAALVRVLQVLGHALSSPVSAPPGARDHRR
ncbi:LysR family transcriptional regulator [Tessaracoccus antarcticus]|uniref:LysR family transcriptional regulator n=1 Tax=Tessaracoccus antarcticus TaxID=2479848 RepID=A0A3M0G7X5_9ACTN|nr:LysR family transcriptional regulator [Tessaracoccus antarcticus]RMB60237.1 LysR family transcriptional regulator [Tessaracoccus antarcticus]